MDGAHWSKFGFLASQSIVFDDVTQVLHVAPGHDQTAKSGSQPMPIGN
jgi:hypothetical protein